MTQRFVLVFTALAAVGTGCGGVETNSGSAGTPIADGGAFSAPDSGATGRFTLGRDQVCESYVAALGSKATALGCTLDPAPKCPETIDDFERRLGRLGQCLRYDEGSVENCKARIASFSVCGDFASKSCAFVMIVDDTPDAAACARGGDGGVGGDAPQADSASEASPDASPDHTSTSDAAASDAAASG